MKPILKHIEEPKLTFGYMQKIADPRDGLTLFGPYTRERLTGQINIGIIGPDNCRADFKDYLKKIHKPVYNKKDDLARPFFPRLEAAFNVFVNFENIREINIPQKSIEKCLQYADNHIRIHNTVNLFVSELEKYHSQEEVPVNIWYVVIPDDVYRFGKPKSSIPKSDKNIKIKLKKGERSPSVSFLFDDLNKLKVAYQYEMNFHNQIKAKLLKEKIITQIIRHSTISYETLWDNEKRIDAERKFDSAKAWNISNTLYYKAGGIPWKLGEVREKVCYLGLVYKKLETDEKDKNACCAAQMFLESGDGMVFRGNIGPWYNPKTKEFHLTHKDAHELLSKALEAFHDKNKDYPQEIFIHAKTYFDDEEWEGFLEVAKNKSEIVGIRIRDDRAFKLYRDFTYPIPRGSALLIDDRFAYLWTKGFIPRINTIMGLETPNPLSIEITRGNADLEIVCKDILALTKLNYNTCIFGDGIPVTLRFANSIGEILTAGPDIKGEVLPFKHYI